MLDEPNSSLDAEGEAALVKALLALRKRGCTVVVMAHRPSALAAVDRILVLAEGRQAALGPKDEIVRVLNAAAAQQNANVEYMRRG